MTRLQLTDKDDFGRYLARGLEVNEFQATVIETAWNAPLPEGWTEHCTDGKLYFFNTLTDKASWTHPLEETFRDMIAQVEGWQNGEANFANACALSAQHMEQVTQVCCEDLQDWSGPFYPENPEEHNPDTVPRPYYYSTSTEESSWESPLTHWDADLKFRAEAFEQCLNLFLQEPKPFSDNVRSILERFAPLRAHQPASLENLRYFEPSVPESDEQQMDFLSARSDRQKTGRSEFYSAREHNTPHSPSHNDSGRDEKDNGNVVEANGIGKAQGEKDSGLGDENTGHVFTLDETEPVATEG